MDVNNVNDNSFNTIKTNTKKSQMKNDAARTIFDAVDINRDGIISQSEYKGIVKGKTRGKNGKIVVRDYIKVKDLENGRSLVVDKNGKQWIMAHDGSILKATYVAVQTVKENFQKAKKSFKKQKQKDGWAGKAADAISTLWNSKNRASVVSKDLGEHFQLLQQLFQSEKAGSKAFNTKFKEIFGVNYNEAAVTKYLADPTEANYQKAFGNKNNIQNRVEKYKQENPDKEVLKLGIGDVTKPLPKTIVKAMESACEEMLNEKTFRGIIKENKKQHLITTLAKINDGDIEKIPKRYKGELLKLDEIPKRSIIITFNYDENLKKGKYKAIRITPNLLEIESDEWNGK